MFVILSVMVVILAVSGLVLAFVAYPARGRELSSAPWLNEVLSRAAGALPLIAPDAAHPDPPDRRPDAEPDRASRTRTPGR